MIICTMYLVIIITSQITHMKNKEKTYKSYNWYNTDSVIATSEF